MVGLFSRFLIFSIIILVVLPSSTTSVSFSYPNFSLNGLKINLENDSFTSNNVLDLTKNRADGPLTFSVGRATYPEPIQLWDAASGRVTDFSTTFSFIIRAVNQDKFGDGMTFFLAPFGSTLPPESNGGALGLLSSKEPLVPASENQIVAVEFDTFKNSWDPSENHVGINVNSIQSVANVSWNSSIKDGRRANAWVTYNSTSKNLSVFLTYAENPVFSGNSSLFHIVDLSKILPEKISVGFSASTGSWIEIHQVLSWQFNSTLESMVEGKGNKIGLIVGLVVGLVVASCALGLALFIWLKKRGNLRKSIDVEKADSDMSMDDEFEKGTGPKRFTYRELVYATSNFDEGGKLGEGGFGGVYKGFLGDLSLNVAVKRVSRGSKQGKKEYQSEVRIISQLRHRNLVQLISWCHERNELLLVYEFMPNRSLDNHLFRGENVLVWEVRYKIALGLASALLYLHEEWEQCVVHRDVKSSNDMLDSNFNAKLGDFGLARLVDHDDLGSQTTVLAGTLGYLAPECVTTGKSSKESDVYSFGIVALEVACGRKPVEQNRKILVEWVWELYGSGKIIEAADERLKLNSDEQQIERLMVLGLWCAHPDPTTRPSIRQVINILNFESPLPNLPSKLPTPVYLSPPMHMCKLALASTYGYSTSSQTDGSQCTCSSCTNTNLSQATLSSASSSPSKSLLHSHKSVL